MAKLLFIFLFLFFSFYLGLTTQKEYRKVLCHKYHITWHHNDGSHDRHRKVVHRPCSSCISSIEKSNGNSIEFSLSITEQRAVGFILAWSLAFLHDVFIQQCQHLIGYLLIIRPWLIIVIVPLDIHNTARTGDLEARWYYFQGSGYHLMQRHCLCHLRDFNSQSGWPLLWLSTSLKDSQWSMWGLICRY